MSDPPIPDGAANEPPGPAPVDSLEALRPALVAPPSRKRISRRSPRQRRRRKPWLLAGAGVLVLAVLAIGADLFFRYLPAARALQDGQRAVTQVRDIMNGGISNLSSANLDEVTSLLNRAADDFGSKSRVIDSGWLLDIGARLPFMGDQVTAVRAMRAAGQSGAQLGLDLIPVIRQALPPPGSASSPALARLVQVAEAQGAQLGRVVGDLNAMDAAAGNIPTSAGLVGPLQTARSLVQSLLPRIDGTVRPAIDLLRLLPAAVGAGQHRYLLLLDNPGEQRPGGGFIGAVGQLTVSEGVVIDKSFRAGDFAGASVTSPAPRGLTEFQHPLELQDSNWSPDFPTSAAAAAHLYQQATGYPADGVIGLDPTALSYVLAVTGTVSVPGYPQTVGAQDTLLTLNEITNRARPSDPGKVYLPPFGVAMLDRILTAPLSQDAGIASALVRAANEKHIVMSFNDPALMAKTDAAGFSGRVTDPASDALQLVDANVGGNKADLVVTREYTLSAVVGADGQVRDTVALQYQNPTQTDPALRSLVGAFNGAYHDYLRVYIPETASLQLMTLQRGTAAPTAVSPEGIDFELQRQAIAYILVVPSGEAATLTLTYTGPFVDSSASPVQYTLNWTKQIGAPAWPISVDVSDGRRHTVVRSDLNVDRSWTVPIG